MPTFGPIHTAGEGHVALPDAEEVASILLRATRLDWPEIQFHGTLAPRGVFHVGVAGLGSWPDDSLAANPPYVSWYRFLRHETERWWIEATQASGFTVGSVFWRWNPSVEIDITVFW